MKRMGKMFAASFVVLSLLLSLTGCGEVQKAETSVQNMFAALKALDFEEAQKYIDLEEMKTADSEEVLSGNTELFMKTLFDRLDYEIVSSEKVDSNTVQVQTKITAVDMAPVLQNFLTAAMQYAFANAFADPQPTEEETAQKMEELFVESATQPDLATVVNEVSIQVVKEDNAWKIASDDALVDALLGGLAAAAEELENSLNE